MKSQGTKVTPLRGPSRPKFLDAFSDRNTTNQQFTNTYQDSFNRVDTNTTTSENVGNTVFTLGGGGGGGGVESVPVLAVVGLLVLAGVFLLTRE